MALGVKLWVGMVASGVSNEEKACCRGQTRMDMEGGRGRLKRSRAGRNYISIRLVAPGWKGAQSHFQIQWVLLLVIDHLQMSEQQRLRAWRIREMSVNG